MNLTTFNLYITFGLSHPLSGNVLPFEVSAPTSDFADDLVRRFMQSYFNNRYSTAYRTLDEIHPADRTHILKPYLISPYDDY